jgi:hypothetical protein
VNKSTVPPVLISLALLEEVECENNCSISCVCGERSVENITQLPSYSRVLAVVFGNPLDLAFSLFYSN